MGSRLIGTIDSTLDFSSFAFFREHSTNGGNALVEVGRANEGIYGFANWNKILIVEK